MAAIGRVLCFLLASVLLLGVAFIPLVAQWVYNHVDWVKSPSGEAVCLGFTSVIVSILVAIVGIALLRVVFDSK